MPSEKGERLRRWYHAEVCQYLPEGGINCDDLAQAAMDALTSEEVRPPDADPPTT